MQQPFKKIQFKTPSTPGVKVIGGDLKTAMRIFRQEVIESEKLLETYNRRYFKPKSRKKREMMEKARYLEQFRN